jgi:ribonuclease R
MAERRADDASRDVAYWLKCQYMVDKIGEIYTGVVTGVTAFGLFVELEGIFIEGLIHVTSLKNDYYHYDAPHHRLRGERSGNVYHLSDRLQVRVVRVNVEEKKIDLIPAEV